MNSPIEKSDSLKKALDGSKTFDEASYYKSKQVEMGGDDVLEDIEEEFDPDDDDEEIEDEFYGDED